MTREELVQMREYQVAQASTEYYNKHPKSDPISAFEDGVAWADEHPKNPWHKTDEDFPKEGVHYQMKDGEFLCGKPMLLHICEDDDDSGDDYKGYFDGKFWRYWDKHISCDVVMGKVTHWMLIPTLP